MALDPIDHVAAVAGAERALAIFINERIRLLRIVETEHQVLVWCATPVAVDGVNKFLSVAG